LISLDHIALWSNNLFAATYRLSQETGIGSTNGGYFPGLGLGQTLLSLGDYVYIEVESITDHRMIADRSKMALELEKQTANGDCFAGLCFRTDDMAELEAFARHRGVEVSESISGGKVRMVPPSTSAVHAPSFWDSWRLGKPNLYYVPDLEGHPSRQPPQPGTGQALGLGIVSIEIGGTEADLKSWLGDVVDPSGFDFEIVYNDGPDGLYAVTFNSTDGEKTVRRNPISL
jgi:hypothetical protein